MRRLVFVVLVCLPASRAAADLLPEPDRPADWNEHALPPPPPPPDKDLGVLLWSACLVLAAAGLVSRRHRLRELPR